MALKSIGKVIAACILALLLVTPLSAENLKRYIPAGQDSINVYLHTLAYFKHPVKIEKIIADSDSVKFYFKKTLRELPFREDNIEQLYSIARKVLPKKYRNRKLQIYSAGVPIEHYISSYYSSSAKHLGRQRTPYQGAPWIQMHDRPYKITQGLDQRHIAIWAGHGRYYNPTDSVWKWQRAPLFSTIEDIFPHTIMTDFIIPMLENAGAYVLTPRERDYNTSEIIVDNDSPFYTERNVSRRTVWTDAQVPGYGETKAIFSSDVNPFTSGKSRIISASKECDHPLATYLPWFPETAEYAVYVSYTSLPVSGTATYTIRHSSGTETVAVDQRRGGNTWIYLGTYLFTEGESAQGVSISIGESQPDKFISTDAVRFGGGMGIVARGSTLSGLPKFLEGARYSLQAYGFPQEVFNPMEDSDDYKDDYISKGLWVNALKNDYDIPVDMAIAVHTDAGVVQCDSIVGTLAIYKEESDGSFHYSDGSPRRTARELADIVQTTVVEDIRALYRENWSRRGLRDRSYMEARTPDVPTVLLEMFSHQNSNDMKCALDPKFRFILSRAIYKGILRYLSFVYDTPYTVQPIPVRNFAVEIQEESRRSAKAVLTWSPSHDSLEPSAKPTSYLVQTRITKPDSPHMSGFDHGVVVSDSCYTVEIEANKIYSFRVIALNEGGASFPSEILSAGYVPRAPKVLLVNSFTEVSATNFITGEGTPYIRDYAYIGKQYDFDTTSVWISDDQPGFGASHTDHIGTRREGNTFDYPYTFGKAILLSGKTFTSCSLTAYETAISPIAPTPTQKSEHYETIYFIKSEDELVKR